MLKLGFHQQWISLLMLCVESVKYSIFHGGREFGAIIPERGLRQGDPLSPYLFILCAEGLSAALHHKENQGVVHGCRITRHAPIISHLLFVDDCFLFFRANALETSSIKQCLEEYELASGQKVNYQKSAISFSPNTTTSQCEDICSLLGVQHEKTMSRYLGLPPMVGRNKYNTFRFLKDRVWQKLNSWRGRFLSRAGKEVLLKAVIQAIPSYTMSLFMLPMQLCIDIERLMNRFWWSSAGLDGKGVVWQNWERLSTPKSRGGMGFRNLHAFNIALLAKQGWRLLYHPEALVSKVLKAKYYNKCDFLSASLGNNPSYVWRSLHAGQDLLRSGSTMKVGNGHQILVKKDPWLPDQHNPFISTPLPNELSTCTVQALLSVDGSHWDEDLI